MSIQRYEFKKIPPQVESVAYAMQGATRGFKGVSAQFPVIRVSQRSDADYSNFDSQDFSVTARVTQSVKIELEMSMEVTDAQQLRKIAELKTIDPAIKFAGVTDLDYIIISIEHAAQEELQPLRIDSEATGRIVQGLKQPDRVYLILTITLDMTGREWSYDPERGNIFVFHRIE